MTITLPTTACRRADRASRLAHRRTPASEPVGMRVPAPRESTENLAPAPSRRGPSVRADPHRRHIPRTAMRDDEWAAQGLALATESANLRERVSRHVAVADSGGPVDLADVEAVLRALRSYDPFLGESDRALNVAARRRLIAALA